jgi:hypothetical protein
VEGDSFFYFAKCWDMLVAKMLLALTGFNFYVMSTGLTYLEFRSMMETRARDLNRKFYGTVADTGIPSQDKHLPSLLKFNYGFSTHLENIWRVAKTKNLAAGVLFCTLGEDSEMEFNGFEWSIFYFWRSMQATN